MMFFDYHNHDWSRGFAVIAAKVLNYPLDLSGPAAYEHEELEVFADYCKDRSTTFKKLANGYY